MKLLSLLRPLLARRQLPVAAALLALVLALPALWTGRSIDDYVHHLMLRPEPPFTALRTSPLNLFVFFNGDRAENSAIIDHGITPWWTYEDIRIQFWRPLSSLSHALDHWIWPDDPVLMHAHSLAWFALLTFFAALLYRRLLGATWGAGLAALLFAIDDAHALPAAWIANRNSLLATSFGFLALLAYDRWRRDGWRPGATLAPLALLLGLLSGEMAVATGGYLLAHALFLEAGPLKKRLLPLAPAVVVGVLWYLGYKMLGYGATGSGLYIDPGSQPDRYLLAVLKRGPLLWLAQLGFPPSDITNVMPESATRVLVAIAVVFTAAVAVLFAPLVRRSAEARFFALGAGLSLLPVCGTFPMDRLLFFVGFGAFGLVALFLAGKLEGAGWRSESQAWRVPAGALATFFVFIHLIAAPLLFPLRTQMMKASGDIITHFSRYLPNGPAAKDQDVVLINVPDGTFAGYFPIMAHFEGRQVPRRLRILAEGTSDVTTRRTDERTLVVSVKGGWLQNPTNWLVRSPQDIMPKGHRIELGEVTIEVLELTEDGRPAEVAFHFAAPLEDASLYWLKWEGDALVPFVPPPVGGEVTLPAQQLKLF